MKTGLVTALVSTAFYGGIAWGITKFIDGGRKEYFWALGILIGMRAFYAVLEFGVGVVVWRVYGRRRTVDDFVGLMRGGNLPKRVYCSDNIGEYFARIINPSISDYRADTVKADVKKLAADLDNVLDTVRGQRGMMAEIRTWDAMNRALEIHSPYDDSPQLVSFNVLHWFRSDVTESEILALPNASPELARRIIAERPFETLTDLYQLLRKYGLDKMEASLFLNGASEASDEWQLRRGHRG